MDHASDASRSIDVREPLVLLALTALALGVSAVRPYDYATWWMEVAPVLIAAPVLVLTARRFPLTPLVYRLIFLHALVLIVGGHYTYARVPLGDWVREWLDLERNHYDRLGHLMQGFVPAMVAREIYLRRTPLRRGGWLFFFVTVTCLAISAGYEFIEWWAALIGGSGATEFLGTQGDVWDTQWDMFLAFCGAMLSQVTLGRVHDAQLDRLPRPGGVSAAPASPAFGE